MIPLITYIEEALRGCYDEHELRDLAWWVAEEATGLSRTELLTRCKDTENIPDLEIILQKLLFNNSKTWQILQKLLKSDCQILRLLSVPPFPHRRLPHGRKPQTCPCF